MKLIHFLNKGTHNRDFLEKLKQWSLQETSYVGTEQEQVVQCVCVCWGGGVFCYGTGSFEYMQQVEEINHTSLIEL